VRRRVAEHDRHNITRLSVVLGIDGLDPDLVSHFMHERKLPNMQKLARANSVAMLRCADM
jgi:predicted AlkP superfamily phosphohydrolase/phosphomutase